MKEWESSSTTRYGCGVTKQEVGVEDSGDGGDSDVTPLAQGERKRPHSKDSKRGGGGEPDAKKGPITGASSSRGEPISLSAASVNQIVGQVSEDFAGGVLANVKDAVSSQGTTVVATALREEGLGEVAARLNKVGEKTKRLDDKPELAIAEQVKLRKERDQAEVSNKVIQGKLNDSSIDLARHKTERDSWRARVESLELDKGNLRDHLNAALGSQSFSPRATYRQLTTPRKTPKPGSSWPPSPSKPPFSQE